MLKETKTRVPVLQVVCKPAAISAELAKFLGVAPDTKMARTDVTKMITSYVKDNNLQDSNNGRKIVPDAKLKALLNVFKVMKLPTSIFKIHETTLRKSIKINNYNKI